MHLEWQQVYMFNLLAIAWLLTRTCLELSKAIKLENNFLTYPLDFNWLICIPNRIQAKYSNTTLVFISNIQLVLNQAPLGVDDFTERVMNTDTALNSGYICYYILSKHVNIIS